MRVSFLIFAAIMSIAPVRAWAGACSVEATPVSVSDGAVDTALAGTVSFYVTCPEGQAWTLYENAGAQAPYWDFRPSGGPGLLTICRSTATPGAACNSSPLSTGIVMASGTGTGSPQAAAQLKVNATRTGSWPGVQYASGKYVLPVWAGATINTASNLLIKLVSASINYYPPALTATMSVTQECIISGTTNMSINYTGAALGTGSFGITYACGYGTVPPMTMSIGQGSYSVGNVRRAAKAGGYLGYRLFWDSEKSQEIGAVGNSATLPESPSYGTKNIYGSVLRDDPGFHSPNGNGVYSDVVSIEVSY